MHCFRDIKKEINTEHSLGSLRYICTKSHSFAGSKNIYCISQKSKNCQFLRLVVLVILVTLVKVVYRKHLSLVMSVRLWNFKDGGTYSSN